MQQLAIEDLYRDPRTAFGARARIPVGTATELSSVPPEFQRSGTPAPQNVPQGVEAKPTAAAAPKVGAMSKIAGAARSILSPAGLAAGGAIDGAIQGLGTPTENYYRRLGLDPADAGANGFKDLAVRGAGVVSDIGAGILDLPMAAVNKVRDFAGAERIPTFGEILRANDGAPTTARPTRIDAPSQGAGAGRGFVNPPLVNPSAPPPVAPRPVAAPSSNYGVSVVGNGDGGESVRGIEARTSAINQRIGEVSRQLDGYGAGPQGGGIGAINGVSLSKAANDRFNNTPSGSVLAPSGQTPDQFFAQQAAQREGIQQRGAVERGQDIAAATQLGIANLNTGAQLRVAGLNGETQRGVAQIGADARKSAAETAAEARAAASENAASARVAAAEAGSKRYIHMPGGDEVLDIGGGPTKVRRPDRIFDTKTGQAVEVSDAPSKAAPPAGAVKMLRDNPKLAADFDAKYGAGAAAKALGK